jgi:hypothetical protein
VNKSSKLKSLLQDPSGADGGTYRCHVKNDYGESNANLNLNIESEPELDGNGPTFVEKPRITSEKNGKLVIMDFKVKADPKPTITWYREGKVIKESSKIKISMTQTKEIYYIRLELTVSCQNAGFAIRDFHQRQLSNFFNCLAGPWTRGCWFVQVQHQKYPW